MLFAFFVSLFNSVFAAAVASWFLIALGGSYAALKDGEILAPKRKYGVLALVFTLFALAAGNLALGVYWLTR